MKLFSTLFKNIFELFSVLFDFLNLNFALLCDKFIVIIMNYLFRCELIADFLFKFCYCVRSGRSNFTTQSNFTNIIQYLFIYNFGLIIFQFVHYGSNFELIADFLFTMCYGYPNIIRRPCLIYTRRYLRLYLVL